MTLFWRLEKDKEEQTGAIFLRRMKTYSSGCSPSQRLFYWLCYHFWIRPLRTTTLTKPMYAKLLMKICKFFFGVGIFSYFQPTITFPEWQAAEGLHLHYSWSQASGTQERHSAAIFSVQNDFLLSWIFIIKMAHHNLLHSTANIGGAQALYKTMQTDHNVCSGTNAWWQW